MRIEMRCPGTVSGSSSSAFGDWLGVCSLRQQSVHVGAEYAGHYGPAKETDEMAIAAGIARAAKENA